MSAFLVIEAEITDPVGFLPYTKAVPPLVKQFGGEYLSLAGEAESLEGDWGSTKVVLHKWPDMESARRFWHSEEYSNAKSLREGTGNFRVILIDGLNKETLE